MAEELDAAYRLMERFAEEGVAGSALCVSREGEIVAEHYVGQANLGMSASEETLWPLASISKLYAAAAAMSCLERGELALSTKVSSLIPEFTGGGRELITLRHCLTHTSGLPYESKQMAERLAAKWSLEDLIMEAASELLIFAPGKDQAYSDYAVGLAGLMCARAAGMSFPELVRTRVIEPGGLMNTFMPPPDNVSDRIAYVDGALAEGTDGAMYNSAYARALAHPAFGAIASAKDLLKFGLLFDPNRQRQLFSQAGTETMISDQTGYDFPDAPTAPRAASVQAWGLGFQLKERLTFPELVSPRAFGHPGASGCILVVDPVLDVAFAFTSNRHLNLGYDAWTDRLMRISNVVMACMSR
ncbi:MAG TPA: serine hydrolase domain-containing protein [Thermomicrobiales bacterium]|nr:serine hydrolase domain-containing protein [Thermomicrobiales bacterium]